MPRRVLLTGCTGWLGETIVPYFSKRYEVDVLSRKPGTSLTGDARTIQLDKRYDYIIHGALQGAQNILEQACDAKVLLLSSQAVYGQQTSYAVAKRADEAVCFGHAVIARLFSCIGPNMPERFVAGEFLACLRDHKPLTVRHPRKMRSYLHVDEVPVILERLVNLEYPDVVDVGSPQLVTLWELAHHIARYADLPVHSLDAPAEQRDIYTARLRNAPWPDIDLTDAIQRTVKKMIDDPLKRLGWHTIQFDREAV
jgi:nucleoside-diphosphate-sugar epimerase